MKRDPNRKIEDWTTSYLDKEATILLASVRTPRAIIRSEDLHDLHLYGGQDLVNMCNSQLRRERNGELCSIPISGSLTEYGRIALKYMYSQMSLEQCKEIGQEVKKKRKEASDLVNTFSLPIKRRTSA